MLLFATKNKHRDLFNINLVILGFHAQFTCEINEL